MPKLGQHFLNNPAVIKRIATAVLETTRPVIVEIGPGHGELTEALAEDLLRSAKEEATARRLIAIEKDPMLAAHLREKFRTIPFVEIIEGDVRKILTDTTARAAPFTLCGNLPYYLTGYLLRLIGELQHKPDSCIFMMQKEVAERLSAHPPAMNKLAAAVQFWGTPQLLFSVKRENFSPPPRVESAVIRLTTAQTVETSPQEALTYYRLLARLFLSPRKTILNNLSLGLAASERKRIEELLNEIDVDPKLRPQNLTISNIRAISERASQEESARRE